MYSQVTLEEATAKSNQLGLMFMETSAKAGHNVKSLFKKIAMSLPGMEKDIQLETNTSPFLHHPFCQTLFKLTSAFQKSMSRQQSQQMFLTHRHVIVENLSAFHDLTYVVLHAFIYRHCSPRRLESHSVFLVYHYPILPARTLEPVCGWNGRKCFRGSNKSYILLFSHPRFIVFPAPLGFSSVNLAQFSSFNRFTSAFSSPSRVPSSSASSASCSDEVGAASDAGLQDLGVRIQGQSQRWVTYPPPLSILPRSRSICRYSSIDIVGNRCPGPKTWA